MENAVIAVCPQQSCVSITGQKEPAQPVRFLQQKYASIVGQKEPVQPVRFHRQKYADIAGQKVPVQSVIFHRQKYASIAGITVNVKAAVFLMNIHGKVVFVKYVIMSVLTEHTKAVFAQSVRHHRQKYAIITGQRECVRFARLF